MNLPTNGQRAVPRSGGAESATAVPELGKLETRLTCSLGLSAGPEPGLFAGTHHAGQESDRRPRPGDRRHAFHQNATHDLAWSLRWPDKGALYTKKSSGYQQIRKKKQQQQEWLKMITAFFSDFISSLLCEQWKTEKLTLISSLRASLRDGNSPVNKASERWSERYLVFIRNTGRWKLSSLPVIGMWKHEFPLADYTLQSPNNKMVNLSKLKLELTSFSVRSFAASWTCIFTHTLML